MTLVIARAYNQQLTVNSELPLLNMEGFNF